MTDLEKGAVVDEILSALEITGEFESWIDSRMPSEGNREQFSETYCLVTHRLLGEDPPRTDRWEHLLFVTAASSAKSNQMPSCEVCAAAIAEFTQMIQADRFAETDTEHVVALASALTMALAAQRRLRQPIEVATRTLHEKFPDLMPAMAELSQDIWQRYGQMSGLVGLYLWDCRNHEWRLNQDFKPRRPA